MYWNLDNADPSIINGVKLWMACLVFIFPLKWRNHIIMRLAAAEIAVIVITVYLFECLENIYGWETYWFIWAELYMIVAYFSSVVMVAACVEVKGFEAWYCSIWICLTYMFLQEISRLIIYMCPYGKTLAASLLQSSIYVTALAGIGVTIARWMPVKGHYVIGPRQMVSAWILGFMFDTLCMYISYEDGNMLMNLMMQFYCITLLYLQSVLFKKSSISKELDTIQLLWHQQKEQYRISKETIELINHKCHDLKHQMHAMTAIKDGAERETYLKEIEDSVQIYSAIVHTGNDILDVILTEKSLLCESSGIHINCVADGKLLAFMDSVDQYALFGNALDNAIEAVRGLAQEEARLIDLMIYAKQNFLVIQVVNPVEGKIEFEDGLPKTTKAKNGYHGYGMKSMRHTIEKYGGYLTAEVKDGCFYLRIMAPL